MIEAMRMNTVALQQVMGGSPCQIPGVLYSGQQTQVGGEDGVELVMPQAMEKAADEHYFSRRFKARTSASPIPWRTRFQRKST